MTDGTRDASRTTAVELTAEEIDELLNSMQAAENEGGGHNEALARKLTAALTSLKGLRLKAGEPLEVMPVSEHEALREAAWAVVGRLHEGDVGACVDAALGERIIALRAVLEP